METHTKTIPLLAQGYNGVSLFFVISGFLIVTLILREREGTGSFSIRNFYARRTLRIWPAYFFVLAVYIAVVLLLEHNVTAKAQFFGNLPYFATFTSNLFIGLDSADRIIFYFAWSLAAEQQFYLVWPWIEKIVPGLPALGLAIATIVIAAISSVMLKSSNPVVMSLTTFPCFIGSGVVLAHLLHRRASFGWIAAAVARPGAGLAASLALLAALSFQEQLGDWASPLVALSMTALVASAVIRPGNDVAHLTAWRPLVWIGTISYGLYLWHMLAINIVRRIEAATGVQSSLLELSGGLLIGTALASVSYLTLERYFLRRKRRFASGGTAHI